MMNLHAVWKRAFDLGYSKRSSLLCYKVHGRAYARTHIRTDAHTHGRTDACTHSCTLHDGRLNALISSVSLVHHTTRSPAGVAEQPALVADVDFEGVAGDHEALEQQHTATINISPARRTTGSSENSAGNNVYTHATSEAAWGMFWWFLRQIWIFNKCTRKHRKLLFIKRRTIAMLLSAVTLYAVLTL